MDPQMAMAPPQVDPAAMMQHQQMMAAQQQMMAAQQQQQMMAAQQHRDSPWGAGAYLGDEGPSTTDLFFDWVKPALIVVGIIFLITLAITERTIRGVLPYSIAGNAMLFNLIRAVLGGILYLVTNNFL